MRWPALCHPSPIRWTTPSPPTWTGCSAPDPDYPKLDVEKVRRWAREYLASVRGVDRNIGRVMEVLKDDPALEHVDE